MIHPVLPVLLESKNADKHGNCTFVTNNTRYIVFGLRTNENATRVAANAQKYGPIEYGGVDRRCAHCVRCIIATFCLFLVHPNSGLLLRLPSFYFYFYSCAFYYCLCSFFKYCESATSTPVSLLTPNVMRMSFGEMCRPLEKLITSCYRVSIRSCSVFTIRTITIGHCGG